MVGETGGGKTSMAETMGKGRLLTINCHERTETADLLGRLRPRDGGGYVSIVSLNNVDLDLNGQMVL